MSVSPVIQTCIVSIILTAVITFMLWNTSGLNTVLENSTNSYVKDASFQQANDISSKLNSFELALELLSDSIKKLPNEDLLEEFLKNYLESLKQPKMRHLFPLSLQLLNSSLANHANKTRDTTTPINATIIIITTSVRPTITTQKVWNLHSNPNNRLPSVNR